MPNIVRLLSFIVLSVCSSASIAGQPGASVGAVGLMYMELDELLMLEVQSSSFFDEDAAQAPGYLFIVDQQEFRVSPQLTLKDMLQAFAPGFYVSPHSHWGQVIGTRGLSIGNSTKTLVMADGQNLNMRSNLGYMMGLETPLLGDIERFEVTAGPGSMVHGRGAINGFVNQISKNGTYQPGVRLTTGFGEKDESYRVELEYGHIFGEHHDVFFYAGIHDAHGFEADELYNYEGSIHPLQKNVHSVYEVNQKYSMHYRNGALKAKWFYNETNPSRNNHEEKRGGHLHFAQAGAYLDYEFAFGETESLTYRVSTLFSEAGARDATGKDVSETLIYDRRGSREKNLAHKLIFRSNRFEKHNFAAGVEGMEREFNGQKWFFEEEPNANAQGVDGSWIESAFFAEDVWHITQRWSLSLGARYDSVSSVEVLGDTHPSVHKSTKRLGLSYRFNGGNMLKLSYQEGFRYPDALNFKDSKNRQVDDGSGNLVFQQRMIRPEVVESVELNFSWLMFESGKRTLRFNVNVFHNDYYDSIKWQEVLPEDPEGMGRGFVNADEQLSSDGLEAILNFKTEKQGIKFIHSFSKLHADNLDWLQHPENTFKFLWSAQITNKVELVNHIVYLPPYDTSRYPASEYFNKSSLKWDSSINYKWTSNLALQLATRNITEEDTPTMNVLKKNAWAGNLGDDERRVYLTLSGAW